MRRTFALLGLLFLLLVVSPPREAQAAWGYNTIDLSDLKPVGKLSFTGATTLTLASDAVTVTQTLHLIDTEKGGATDNLSTISGGADGQLLAIRAAHTDRTIVVKHNVGNIYSGGADITLDDTSKYLLFVYDAALTKWIVVGGSAAAVDLTAPGPIGSVTASTGAFTTVDATSTITGLVKYQNIAGTGNITACAGHIVRVTAAGTATLPAATTVGQRCKILSTTANIISVDVASGSDTMTLNDVALAAGNKATSDGTLGATLICDNPVNNSWICIGNHVWADGG